jgi:CheY-like chemotaxis protein
MKNCKRILLVEDDLKDIELTLAGLAEHNLANEVAVARDGVEALDYLYRRGSLSCLVRSASLVAQLIQELNMPLKKE